MAGKLIGENGYLETRMLTITASFQHCTRSPRQHS